MQVRSAKSAIAAALSACLVRNNELYSNDGFSSGSNEKTCYHTMSRLLAFASCNYSGSAMAIAPAHRPMASGMLRSVIIGIGADDKRPVSSAYHFRCMLGRL